MTRVTRRGKIRVDEASMDTDDVADSIMQQEPENPTRSAEAARRAEAQGGGEQEEQKGGR